MTLRFQNYEQYCHFI